MGCKRCRTNRDPLYDSVFSSYWICEVCLKQESEARLYKDAIAIKEGLEEIGYYFFPGLLEAKEKKDSADAFCIHMYYNQIEKAKELLLQHPISQNNDDVRMMFHYACFLNKEEIVLHMLERGADANIPYKNGSYNPVMIAAAIGSVSLMKLLELYGGNTHIKEPDSISLLRIAVAYQNPEMVRYFLNKGVSPHEESEAKITPFEQAVFYTLKKEVLDIFLEFADHFDEKEMKIIRSARMKTLVS